MSLQKPAHLFARDAEWADLSSFVEGAGRLGVVWGPRRAGKSTLLASIADATGGLYYEAVRQDAALSLAELGRAAGARLGVGQIAYRDWTEAITSLVSLPDCPVVVLDEFGYLCDTDPALPSVIQRVVDTGRRSKQQARLVLCGSSVAQLSHLLDRGQPLFGRAQLASVIDAFDVRTAAEFWGVADEPGLALRLHAVVGGLAGLRDILTDAPSSLRGFDRWIVTRVLTPGSPLLEEDALVLQGPGLEANIYRSVLTAVALGDQTPTGVSSRIGRPVSALARPFDKLTEAGLLDRIPDPLRTRRSRYELADPFLVFHDAIVRPHRTRIRRRSGVDVWAESHDTWQSRILGPHFERVCRDVVVEHEAEFGLTGLGAVGSSTVSDPSARRSHEIDLVAATGDGAVAAIGECKFTNAKRGIADLDRLDHLRRLLPKPADQECRLLLFGASGFTRELTQAAKDRRDVELIDLHRLYGRTS